MQSNEVNTKMRILKVIEKAAPQDLSIQEIADRASISRETVSKYILALEAEKKIEKTRQIGKAKMYKLIEEKEYEIK